MDTNFLAVKDSPAGKKNNKRRNNKKEDVKVVYISSPIKVEICASKFRALVQELTGKDSDIADSHFGGDHVIPDDSNSPTGRRHRTEFIPEDFPAALKDFRENDQGLPEVFSGGHHQPHQMEDGFMEMMLSSSLFNEYYSSGYGLNT